MDVRESFSFKLEILFLKIVFNNQAIYGIQKDGNYNPVCETARDTDVQNSLLDSVGDGEGGMISENGIETCIISYMK